MFCIWDAFEVVVIYFTVVETKGLTLEEIEEVFAQGHVFSAWQIKRDVGKKTLDQVVQERKAVDVSDRACLFLKYTY